MQEVKVLSGAKMGNCYRWLSISQGQGLLYRLTVTGL